MKTKTLLWGVAALAGAVGVVVTANSRRFQQRVRSEARALLASSQVPVRIDRERWDSLPDPVRRYLHKAIPTRTEAVRSVRLQQTGTFRPDLKGRWFPIKAVQYFAADPPAFVWWGRVQLLPGIWIEARDKSVEGTGEMLIVAESTLTMNDARGPLLDQGALLRLLGELAWLPAAFAHERYVRWARIDDRHAEATLSVGGRTVTGAFEFGADDLPHLFTAERYRDIGGGRSVLTTFLGECADYRDVNGVLVPHHMVGSWIVDGVPAPYARFDVARLEFDPSEPY